MTDNHSSTTSATTRILTALGELISALDRRVPHIERAGETRIAREAQRLRLEAVARIDELRREGSGGNAYDKALVESIMTDDGAPCRRG